MSSSAGSSVSSLSPVGEVPVRPGTRTSPDSGPGAECLEIPIVSSRRIFRNQHLCCGAGPDQARCGRGQLWRYATNRSYIPALLWRRKRLQARGLSRNVVPFGSLLLRRAIVPSVAQPTSKQFPAALKDDFLQTDGSVLCTVVLKVNDQGRSADCTDVWGNEEVSRLGGSYDLAI